MTYRKLADSPTTEYRYCLDALIATIADMTFCLVWFTDSSEEVHWELYRGIQNARIRASELAGRLYDKWMTTETSVEEHAPCEWCGRAHGEFHHISCEVLDNNPANLRVGAAADEGQDPCGS